MKPGDVIEGMGDIDIKNIYDLTFALKYYRAGDQVELRWRRDQQKWRRTVTLKKRGDR